MLSSIYAVSAFLSSSSWLFVLILVFFSGEALKFSQFFFSPTQISVNDMPPLIMLT